MPDKHIGRDRIYEAIQIQIFRKVWGSPAINYRWQGTVGPFYIKSRAEIPGIFRQIALANKSQGMYDWGFKHKSMGMVTRKTVEDVDWQAKENAKKGITIG